MGGGWGWLDKSIIMLISAPVGFELGLGAELGNNLKRKKTEEFAKYISKAVNISVKKGGSSVYRCPCFDCRDQIKKFISFLFISFLV